MTIAGSRTYEVRTAADLLSALKICLELRKDGFWSFRGQRNPAWELGLHGDEKLDHLDYYFEEFLRRCKEFPPPHFMEEQQEWRWLFFAQHHRLKTRLLDWTKDPLVAIYFAVEDIISREKNSPPGAIWALQVHSRHFKRERQYQLINPTEDREERGEKEWIMVNPPPVTARLARQSGLFSFHPGKNCREPLSTMARRQNEKLIKIIFADSVRDPSPIREQLGILNIHHGSLFPDPQGIAEFVNMEWPFIALEEFLRLTGQTSDKPESKVAQKASGRKSGRADRSHSSPGGQRE